MAEITPFLRKRREALALALRENSLGAAVFIDLEGTRDPAIRYLTGHPGDAVFALSAGGMGVLSPWDENLAALMADADSVIPFTAFDLDPVRAASEIVRGLGLSGGAQTEIPGAVSYPNFLKYAEAMKDFTVICREFGGAAQAVRDMRAIKDDYEMERIRRASAITDEIINLIEEGVRKGRVKTEIDAALLIERESRIRGAEGAGFVTLAAGPSRSFGIHCFPAYTAAPFPAPGLSILDFGVLFEGYTSDVTLTIAMGRLSAAQEEQLSLVRRAYGEALALYRAGLPVSGAAKKAQEIFASAGRNMPHALGHGIGLEVHEYPRVKVTSPAEAVFLPGMAVTLEPGLYHPDLGGCRFENDILITRDGNETLTSSRIISM